MSFLQQQAVSAAMHQLFVVRDPEVLLGRALARVGRDPAHKFDRGTQKLARDPAVRLDRGLNRLANPKRAFHI